MQLSAVRPPAGVVTPSSRLLRGPVPEVPPAHTPDGPHTRRIVLRPQRDDVLPARAGALRSYLDELTLGLP